MRARGRAIRRIHDRAFTVGSCAAFRALAGRTFSRSQREGARSHPGSARKRPVEQFRMAHAHDRRRNFCRTNRLALRRWSPSRWYRRTEAAFDSSVSKIDNATHIAVAAPLRCARARLAKPWLHHELTARGCFAKVTRPKIDNINTPP